MTVGEEVAVVEVVGEGGAIGELVEVVEVYPVAVAEEALAYGRCPMLDDMD